MKQSLISMIALAASPVLSRCKPIATSSVETKSTYRELLASKPKTSTEPTFVSTTHPEATSTTTANSAAASAAAFYSSSNDSTTSFGSIVTGEATFYGGNVAGGQCSFSKYSIPSGLFGTAFSGSAWNTAAHCGECVEVTGPNGKTITAMVVDKCPECAASHLDLFQDAFEQIGSISAGIIDISYQFVSCPITSALELHNKEGTSAYWFSMQVVNANEPVSKLEVSTDGGSTWQSTTRQVYNYFENSSGFGTDTVDVRITSTSGKTINVNKVSCLADSSTTAGSNFA